MSLLARATALLLLFAAAAPGQSIAYRTSLGTPLGFTDEGLPRYREDSGWNSPHFNNPDWGVEYGASLSATPWVAVLQTDRQNAAFVAGANQLLLDLNGHTYTIRPLLSGGPLNGKTIVSDRLGTGASLTLQNGTFINEVGGDAYTIIGDAGQTGRLIVEHATVRTKVNQIGNAAGSTGFLTLESGGQWTAERIYLGGSGQGQIALLGQAAHLTVGHLEIGGSSTTGVGTVLVNQAEALFHVTRTNGSGDLILNNAAPTQPGHHLGLQVLEGRVLVDRHLRLDPIHTGNRLAAISIEGGSVTVGGTVYVAASSNETSGGKIYLRGGALQVTAPSAVQLSANSTRQFYWESGTLGFTAATTSLSSTQLANFTRQGAISYGGGRAAGTLAAGQIIDAAGTLTLTGSTLGLAGGTFRAGTALIVNAPLSGYGTLDAIVSGTGAITNTTTQVLRIGALDGANTISSSGDLHVGGRNVEATFSGTSSGSGAFLKVGSGTQAVTGAVLHSGGVEVREGTLAFQGPAARLETSSLTVHDTATLRLAGGATGTAASAVVGSPAAAASARLSLLDSGSRLTIAGDLTNYGGISLTDGILGVGGEIVNHGWLINNGRVEASVRGSGLLTGNGHFAGPVTIADGGTLAPGQGLGTLTFDQLTLGAGGLLELDLALTSVAGLAGDMIEVAGLLSIVATAADPFHILLRALDAGGDTEALAGWDPRQAFSWRFLTASIAEPQALDLSTLVIDSSHWTLHHPLFDGTWSLTAESTGLSLQYTPQTTSVPEPGPLTLLSLAATAYVARRISRRRNTTQP
jgi:fibronectin-binding autotransporter adhesin